MFSRRVAMICSISRRAVPAICAAKLRSFLCGRRVEVDIKSCDLAVPCDDEIHTGVLGRFAFRSRTPRQPSRIVQNLGRAMMRINIVGMGGSEIAGELVQCVVTDESAGRRVQHTIFGVKFLNCRPSASRITFTENFRKIAVEQRRDTTHICAHGRRDALFTGMLVHQRPPCMGNYIGPSPASTYPNTASRLKARLPLSGYPTRFRRESG